MAAHVHAALTDDRLDAAVAAYLAEQNDGGSLLACVREAIRAYGDDKPRTHIVNGFEVPEPMRKAPEGGGRYFIPSPTSGEWNSEWTWANDGTDRCWLKRGLVHATKEAAIANAKAMCGVQP